ncbi:glycosyltransferase [Vibrio makurazakiensis]|uniref:glycosyltransferase family 2 protein n=1 Tax=Vibrio makurazakiensis TaxID=2910250 RepID=UPI003D136E76
MAKVSVIIPTYNCMAFLPKAIDSVLEQTHQDIELIIIDDNSADKTDAYLKTLTDPRISVITTTGVGASQARNMGINQACGDFIAFLDADDFWLPEKLELQLALHAAHPSLGMSFTNYDHLTEQYQSIVDCFSYWEQFHGEERLFIPLNNALEFTIQNNIIGTSTVMVKADVLTQMKAFDAEIEYGEDWDLWLRICEKHPIGALNSIQSGYLMRQSSTTQTDHFKLRNLQSIESILKHYQDSQHTWCLPASAFKSAKARILEGYADYHRGLQRKGIAVFFGLRSLLLAPQKRRFRSLLGDCKSILWPAR